MYAKYDYNPIYKLYESLEKEITGYFDNTKRDFLYKKMDPILKAILQNNGCGFIQESENMIPTCKFSTIIPDEFYMVYIKGGKANDVNEFWDYVEMMGCRYLIVFLDYFEDIQFDGKEYQNEIEKNLADAVGNSVYFDAIAKLVDVFISLCNPLAGTQAFAATAYSASCRYAPYIIAGSIVNRFKRITEDDISGIDLSALKGYIDGDINLILCGIRMLDE